MPDEVRIGDKSDGTLELVERRERRDLPEDAQALSRLLAERFSCRAFRPEPVPRATIEAMLELAQMTPSWCNSQPWEVIVTDGAATDRLRTALFDHASKADYPADTGYEPDVEFPQAYRGAPLRDAVRWQCWRNL
ncbi:nitroreductase family protein [Tardibacter chloracetimidivorans]|uniref:nitroreductase family protein n=1 Tax=Tardibacter chloracetimidivorans TaxID=1921510 RepID=UPI0009FA1B0D